MALTARCLIRRPPPRFPSCAAMTAGRRLPAHAHITAAHNTAAKAHDTAAKAHNTAAKAHNTALPAVAGSKQTRHGHPKCPSRGAAGANLARRSPARYELF